jgi:hypothetical protein
MTKTEPEMVGVLERAAKIKREGCTTCNGHGYINCIPRDGGEPYPCLCGNCSEAERPTPTPAPIEPMTEAELYEFDQEMALRDAAHAHRAPIESTLAEKLAASVMVAVRQARFPKEYADEAHDEFEAIVLVPLFQIALRTPPQSGEVSQEQVEAGVSVRVGKNDERFDFPLSMDRRAKRNHGDQSLARLEERGGLCWAEAYWIINDIGWSSKNISEADAEREVRQYFAPPPPSVEVGLADLTEEVATAIWGSPEYRPVGWSISAMDAVRVMLSRQQPIGVVEDGVETGK